MKTEFTLSTAGNKDNVATVTLIAIGLFALAGGLLTSNPADAESSAAQFSAVQKLEPIVVTASRHADIKLDAILVTASRSPNRVA